MSKRVLNAPPHCYIGNNTIVGVILICVYSTAKEKRKRKEEMERKSQDDENTRKNKPIWKDAAKEVNKFMKGFLNLFTNTGGRGDSLNSQNSI